MLCPTCNRPVEWNASSPWRPFCSERCKLIDLGAWASERHVIPSDEKNMEDDESPATPPTEGPSQ
ncbi:MAG TPA: DNA gyrase inhibitor YacG [Steroidobacteraceae bacterium]|nr:DNA gyrase inhibitor YacG [Steroidobacteraceae bacterium]